MTLRGGNNDTHALLSPSGSKRWMGCPASLICEADIPNTSGASAITGTACHTLAEIHLNAYINGNELPLERDIGACVLDEGKGPVKAPVKAVKGAVLVTEDMIGQVRKYTDYCKPIIDAADYAKLEMRVNLSSVLHPGYEGAETFGTADLVAVMGNMLIVGDLKTGRHKVEAKENKQLMLYALGILKRLRRQYKITTVRLAIFQPYAGGASEWDITVEALEIFAKFASKRAVIALDTYHRGKKNLKASDFKPSADACQWCRFAEQCAAKARNASPDSDIASDSIEMTPEQLKAEWDKLPELRQHIATIEKAVAAAMHAGKKVPGLKLVEGKPGNRSWSDVEAVDAFRANHHNGYLLDKTVPVSPTEAEKIIGKEDPELWAELSKLVTRKPGAPTVADADDTRPEWRKVTEEDLE